MSDTLLKIKKKYEKNDIKLQRVRLGDEVAKQMLLAYSPRFQGASHSLEPATSLELAKGLEFRTYDARISFPNMSVLSSDTELYWTTPSNKSRKPAKMERW